MLVPILNELLCSLVNKSFIGSTSMCLFLFIPLPYQYLKARYPMLNSSSVPFSIPAASFPPLLSLPCLFTVCTLPGFFHADKNEP